jgi:thioredoxin
MSLFGKLLGGAPKVAPLRAETLDAFAELVLESELPVIVSIWSTTCAPCRQLAPVLENVATKYDGRVRVVAVSIEADPDLLVELEIQATPTLIVFERGEEVGRTAGFRPEGWFDEMIATEFPPA